MEPGSSSATSATIARELVLDHCRELRCRREDALGAAGALRGAGEESERVADDAVRRLRETSVRRRREQRRPEAGLARAERVGEAEHPAHVVDVGDNVDCADRRGSGSAA